MKASDDQRKLFFQNLGLLRHRHGIDTELCTNLTHRPFRSFCWISPKNLSTTLCPFFFYLVSMRVDFPKSRILANQDSPNASILATRDGSRRGSSRSKQDKYWNSTNMSYLRPSHQRFIGCEDSIVSQGAKQIRSVQNLEHPHRR